MWTWLASFLGGPVINGLINAYKAKLSAENTADKIAAELAQRELAVQQAEVVAQTQLKIAQIGHWYEPEKLFAYIMVIYFGKIVLWDKVLKLGTTDAITGAGAEWAGLIMAFYFGKRGIENVARILKR
jgi:hypothetical protein